VVGIGVAKIEVYVKNGVRIEKVGEGTIVYSDECRPMPVRTEKPGWFTANIYCNGVLVGRIDGTYTDTVAAGSGGAAEKRVSLRVVVT